MLFVLERSDKTQPWRLGTAVTRKTGSAVWRNRLRRLIRECLRLSQHAVRPGFDFVLVPKRGLNPRTLSQADVTAEVLPLLEKAALLQLRRV